MVEFDDLPSESLNGLSVLSYSLEIDYDLSGNFIPVIGNPVDQLGLTHIENNLKMGSTYAFRYRARNEYGWSGYGPTSYLLVAVEPGECHRPTFVSATDTTLTVSLDLNTENRGTEILEYQL